MGEKFRNSDRTPWQGVNDRDFAFCGCPELDGVVSLIHFLDIKKTSYCTYSDGEPVIIIKNGYYWLQFAPRGENFWLTALIDENGRFDHAYFDMTDYNVIDGKRSYFCDLYLDIAIKRHGEVFTLDEDELSDALSRGEISKAQYDKAHATAKKVISRFGGAKTPEMIALCDKYFAILSPKLTERKTVRMNLLREPFEKIKSGEKTVELRLFDEKRQGVSVGDLIEFDCEGETLTVKVIDLYRAASFRELFEKFPMSEMGFEAGKSSAEGALAMRKYYSAQKETEHGVLGIKIKI